jgi:AcrR family transcriptional regulator
MLETPVRTDTRARIMSAALELFIHKGFAATTTRELAEQLGFTKAALYYHFRTKDDLLEALVTPAFIALREILDSVPDRPNDSQRHQLLASYIDLTIGSSQLVQAFASDPSMSRRPVLRANWTMFQELSAKLAGASHPGAAARTRVRFALGGIHAALRGLDRADDLGAVQEATLEAATAALGIRTA